MGSTIQKECWLVRLQWQWRDARGYLGALTLAAVRYLVRFFPDEGEDDWEYGTPRKRSG